MFPDFVIGGAIGVISVVLATSYLRYVDKSLMRDDTQFHGELPVSNSYYWFVVVVLVGGMVTVPQIVSLAITSSLEEHIVLAAIATLLTVWVIGFCYYPLCVRVFVSEETICTKSVLTQSSMDIRAVVSIKTGGSFETMTLDDGKTTIRFSLYLEGKRALIEQIIQYAPSEATHDLSALLAKD